MKRFFGFFLVGFFAFISQASAEYRYCGNVENRFTGIYINIGNRDTRLYAENSYAEADILQLSLQRPYNFYLCFWSNESQPHPGVYTPFVISVTRVER